jgi:DNA-directed RNA polymerase subunit N (RpoN/RPB10)
LRYKKTFARRIGQRDKAPPKEVLDEIGVDGREFVIDNYEEYHQLIPEYQLYTGKDLTFPIEE